jgi:hypothetical protein
MHRSLIATSVALAIAGCAVDGATPSGPTPGEITESERAAGAEAAPLKPATPQTVAKIKAAATNVLKDPGSAQWQDVRQATRPNLKGKPTAVACGMVNDKNAFGAYTGFRSFVFLIEDNKLYIAGGGSDVDNLRGTAIFDNFCGE